MLKTAVEGGGKHGVNTTKHPLYECRAPCIRNDDYGEKGIGLKEVSNKQDLYESIGKLINCKILRTKRTSPRLKDVFVSSCALAPSIFVQFYERSAPVQLEYIVGL